VDYVVGLNRLEDLVHYAGQQAPPSASEIAVGDVKRERRVALFGANGLPDRTRAFLKIQEGCNYSCTYCIIPAARGRSRSVPPDQVLSQLGALAGQGYKEVVLTGIHLGGYGHDLSPKWDLTSLVERVVAGNLIPRLRLSSLDPREVSDRLLELMQRSELLCPHLHLCLQAGEDRLLKRMRRNYDTAYYRDLIWRARERVPDAALGTDIIVGFPGESEEDFARSLEFVDSLPLTYFHVFPYSVRRGTVAASLSGQVPAREKRLRAKRMRELGAKKKEEFHRRFVGRRLSVLVESEAGPGCFQGHSRNYLPVFVREAALRPNDEVNVQVDGCGGRGLSGVVCGGDLP
jgi:threonylcarbamoyladenosine tRNA methylthiotransferase MtaB